MRTVERTVETSKDRLRRLRENEGLAVAVGTAIGLGLTFGHYSGLVVGGVLVGVPARSQSRALLFGVAFGLLAWLLFAGWLASNGAFGAFVDMGRLTLVNVAVSIGLPMLGAGAARGLL